MWLDEHLNYDDQAEYVASKATRAFAEIDRLMNKRKGLGPRTGIMLYKSLVQAREVFRCCMGVHV